MIKSDALCVISWNVFTGHKPADVRREVEGMIKDHDPDVIALMEATHLKGRLDGLGYRVFQGSPKPKRRGNISGGAEIALLIRNNLRVTGNGILEMTTFWKGPKHGYPQDPRSYPWVRLRRNGVVWKIGCAHTPFGHDAQVESKHRLVRWVKTSKPGRPVVLVLDANMRLPEFRKEIADPSGMKATGYRIDLIGYKNAELHRSQRLGLHGSDHNAMLYQLLAEA